MSLINDALKRAKDAQPKNATPVASPFLRPVETSYPTPARPDYRLPILIGVILLLAGLLLWQWFIGTVKVRANTVSVVETRQPAPVKIISARPVTPALSESATNLSAVPAKPPAPTYKLQSIFYLPKNPCAMINGKNVYRGDRVGEARVLAISEDSATIVTETGETKVLKLVVE